MLLTLLSLVLVYALLLRTEHTITKAEAKKRFSTEHSHFLQWRGAEIHYTDVGQGTPVLMIHGFGGNFTNFDSLADIMKVNYRVVRVDLPGFGMSDLPSSDDSAEALYRDFLAHMLDTLNIDSLYVIGNSLGGWMSWELAASFPQKVKGLVLLGSAGYEIEKVKANIGRIELLDNTLARALLARGLPMSFSMQNANHITSQYWQPNLKAVAVNNGLTNREGNIGNLITLGNSGILPDTTKIAQVQCPTLIVWGKEDAIVPYEHAEKFKRDILNSKVVLYDTCGHVPQIELPHRLANDIEDFIEAYVQPKVHY